MTSWKVKEDPIPWKQVAIMFFCRDKPSWEAVYLRIFSLSQNPKFAYREYRRYNDGLEDIRKNRNKSRCF